MKLIAQLFLFVVAMVGFLTFARAADECDGCGELKIIAKQLKTFKELDTRSSVWIQASQRAIGHLPVGKGRKLNTQQIQAVTELLAASKGNDPDFSIIDANLKLFAANEKSFFAEFKKQPDKNVAQYLDYALNVKLAELDGGGGGNG